MKEYLSHDYSTRNDEKIKLVIRKYGMTGYGVFWAIIEDLYNNANALQLDYVGIAYDLHVDNEMVKSIINDFDLFIINDNTFSSLSIKKRLEARAEKSEKNSNAANIRWSKHRENTNAMQTQCERIENECKRNAIIEYNIIEYNNKDIIKEEIEEKPKKLKKEDYNLSTINTNFLPLIEKWLRYKKDKKQKYKSTESVLAFYKSLLNLSKNNPATAEKIIEQSMANNWAGIFELKTNTDKQTPQSPTPLILDTADADKARRLEQEYMQSLNINR